MSARIKETRDKILFWLKEESLSPEEIKDASAYFNFVVTTGDLKLNVVQSSRLIDSLVVASKWTLGKPQLELHRNILDETKRVALYWDLLFMLNGDPQLSEYSIGQILRMTSRKSSSSQIASSTIP